MLRAITLGVLSALAVAAAIACTSLSSPDGGSCSAPSPGAAGCLLPLLAKSVSTGQPWGSALTAAAQSCGTTTDSASSVWAAHAQAEVVEGFVPRAIASDAGIAP